MKMSLINEIVSEARTRALELRKTFFGDERGLAAKLVAMNGLIQPRMGITIPEPSKLPTAYERQHTKSWEEIAYEPPSTDGNEKAYTHGTAWKPKIRIVPPKPLVKGLRVSKTELE